MSATQTWTSSISCRRRRCRSSPPRSVTVADGRLYRSGDESDSACPFVGRLGLSSWVAIDLAARRRLPTLIGTQPTAAAAHDVDSFMPASVVHLLNTSLETFGPAGLQTFAYTSAHTSYSHEQQIALCAESTAIQLVIPAIPKCHICMICRPLVQCTLLFVHFLKCSCTRISLKTKDYFHC